MSSLPFIDPATGRELVQEADSIRDPIDGKEVAPVVNGVPRFVDPSGDYAGNFGHQWNKWKDVLSDDRATGRDKYDLILRRTHFDEYPTEGATLLECGMGGGDDTEVLLRFPFGRVYSFDLSNSVDRAAAHLSDPRLTIFQASIYEIPFPDESFDFVFCHRVLQHTPDPERALRCVCRKVRPGGVLFAHCYKRSWRNMLNYKYKVRWLTKRLPAPAVDWYVETFARPMRAVNRLLHRGGRIGRALANQFVPFEHIPQYAALGPDQLLELEKLVTFDALAPAYDLPMTTREFRGIIESEGFRIDHLHDPPTSPLYCTAVKVRGPRGPASESTADPARRTAPGVNGAE